MLTDRYSLVYLDFIMTNQTINPREAREIIIEAKDYFNRTWSETETENRAFGSLRLAYEYAGFDHVRAMDAATRELNRKRGA